MSKKWFPKKKQRSGKGKRYTDTQKYSYHKRKSKDSYYSRSFVDGFTDPYAENNFSAAKSEMARNRHVKDRTYWTGMYGYRNGTAAAISFKKKYGMLPYSYLQYHGKLPE